ncbi:hypothetical protein JMUB7555_27130 [Staphylococcus aureus]
MCIRDRYKNHQWYFVVANIESKLVNLLNISKIKELYEMGETQECNDITMQNFQQFMVKNETAVSYTHLTLPTKA